MQDNRGMKELINQAKQIEKNLDNNGQFITGMELLLTSENNGTVKDAKISKKFNELKNKMEEVSDLTHSFVSMLNNEKKN